MQLRKSPRQARVDLDCVSYPPPLLPRKQALAKRPREVGEAGKQQRPRKRVRYASLGVGSPIAGPHSASSFRLLWPIPPPKPTHILCACYPINWYEPDMWMEIASHLSGYDLVCLSLTCRWFCRLLANDSIWRHAFIRDLSLPATCVPPPLSLESSWRRLYAATFDGSHSYCYHQSNMHIYGLRIGGFLLDTSYVLLAGKLPLPRRVPEEVQLSIEMMGACVLQNVRSGIWIADRHLVRCPVCKTCTGKVQVLDIRHFELVLEEYPHGTWEYEDLGEHFMDEEAATACCAIFNRNHLSSSYADVVRETKSWIRKRYDQQPKACLTPYAVALHSNLQENKGLLTKFQAMRDITEDRQIISIRITQHLI